MKLLSILGAILAICITPTAHAWDFTEILGKEIESSTTVTNTVKIGSHLAKAHSLDLKISSASADEVIIVQERFVSGVYNHFQLFSLKPGKTVVYRFASDYPALQIKLISVDLEAATVTLEIKVWWP